MFNEHPRDIYIYSILHILTIVFPDTRNVEYQPIFNGRDLVIFSCDLVIFSSWHASSVVRVYFIVGERAKRARHSQVCSIENRYIYIIVRTYVTLAL